MGRQTRRLSATRPALSICKTYLIGCQLHKAVSLMDFSGMLQACREKLLMFQSRATDVCTHTHCAPTQFPAPLQPSPPPPDPTHPTTHPPPSSYFSSVYMCRLIKYIYIHTHIYICICIHIFVYIYTHGIYLYLYHFCTYTYLYLYTYTCFPSYTDPNLPTYTAHMLVCTSYLHYTSPCLKPTYTYLRLCSFIYVC